MRPWVCLFEYNLVLWPAPHHSSSLSIPPLLHPIMSQPSKQPKRSNTEKAKQLFKKKAYLLKLEPGEMMKDPRFNDIIIPVMGPTGCGKSSFINSLFGDNRPRAEVGHQLESCTVALQPIVVDQKVFSSRFPRLKGRRLVIVDTPGFDDTVKDDSEILERISNWLALCYSQDMKLAGVIYLHEISQPRMTGATRRNLNVFKKLCGEAAFKLIVLGTTKWGLVEKHLGEARQKQLEEKFWAEMVKAGSRVVPIDGDPWKLVEEVLQVRQIVGDTNMDIDVKVQNELVELKKIIPETEAGKELKYTIDELLKMQRERGIDKSDLRKIYDGLKRLKVPFSRKIMKVLGLQ